MDCQERLHTAINETDSYELDATQARWRDGFKAVNEISFEDMEVSE